MLKCNSWFLERNLVLCGCERLGATSSGVASQGPLRFRPSPILMKAPTNLSLDNEIQRGLSYRRAGSM